MIAVIGGLYRLEGAWLGALVFVVINNYAQDIGFIGDRFHTLIGVVFLVIVLRVPRRPHGPVGARSRLRRGRRPVAGRHHAGEGRRGSPHPSG